MLLKRTLLCLFSFALLASAAQAEEEELAHFFFNDGSGAGTVSVSVLKKDGPTSDFAKLVVGFENGSSKTISHFLPYLDGARAQPKMTYSLTAWGESPVEGLLFREDFRFITAPKMKKTYFDFQFAWNKDHSSIELKLITMVSSSTGENNVQQDWKIVSDLSSEKQKLVTVSLKRSDGFSVVESEKIADSCETHLAALEKACLNAWPCLLRS